jgi:hypothetical protein
MIKVKKYLNQFNFLKISPAIDANTTPESSPIVKTPLSVGLLDVYFK